MLKHNIRISWRNIIKLKEFSLINIFGLAIGLSCVILSALWVVHEQSYESFFSQPENIYVVSTRYAYDKNDKGSYFSPYALSKNIAQTFPEVKAYTRFETFSQFSNCMLRRSDDTEKNFYEQNFCLCDTSFFTIFDFAFKYGQIENAFKNIYSLVLSGDAAKKYFGDENPLGKTLIFNNDKEYTVSGVVDIPKNTQIYFDVLAVNYTLRDAGYLEGWDSNGPGFVKLNENSDISSLNLKMGSFIKDTNAPLREGTVAELFPIQKIHTRYGLQVLMYIISSVAFLILIIAILNYVSLSTALFSKRAKQVAMSKISGASKSNLSAQFLIESILIAFIALLLAFGLVYSILPVFNSITDSQLKLFNNAQWPNSWLFFFLIACLVGFISGIIPSVLLAIKKPLTLLKNQKNTISSRQIGRKTMVVVQFAISILLIASTLFIYKQRLFLGSQPLGFEDAYILKIPINEKLLENFTGFSDELKRNANIINVTAASTIPAGIGNHSPLKWGLGDENMEPNTKFAIVMPNFVNTFDMKMVLGKSFSFSDVSSQNGYIINQTMANRMEDPNPIGRRVNFWGRDGEIIGVVNDFQNNWITREVKPMVLSAYPGSQHFIKFIFIKINGSEISKTLEYIGEVQQQFSANYPFEYSFIDTEIDSYLKDEGRFNSIFLFFSIIAIFLASMGLFGLTLFSSEKRTKEIGVRKVNGARIFEIFNLLLNELVACIIAAFVLTCPLVYLLLKQWLLNFSYKTTLSWWVFAIAGFTVLIIALLTVSWQTYRAARRNPVEALRYE